MIDNYCVETGYVSLNKYDEILCGDHIETTTDDRDSTIVVLADGLGSGVKACILSTLTSKILSTMMANSMPMEDCISTIVSTLPICKVRQLAYSTFTIIRISNHRVAEIIQYDNPNVIMLRNGKHYEYPIISEMIDGKKILKSKINLQENDVFVAMSDGVMHAGVGSVFDFGWDYKDISDFLERFYEPGLNAKTISTMLIDLCKELYNGEPGDDTTACTIKIRKRKQINLLIGPPKDPEDVTKMMSLFFSKEGRHIVCGGTTSTLAAEYLGRHLDCSMSVYVDPDIPPTAEIEGVDLVTEGIITMTRVLEYAKDYQGSNKRYVEWGKNQDGASKIARMLFQEATDINFFVGRAMNPAHQNPMLPIDL
ncbi:MAG TPA: SpoIIE family protein phosphatase, partial [Anaerovoracaceae bacterium]|nr:SpoIIE family protein phosphatase [Anaerovoracaceae bacterium]